jgi:serine/threonine protein kinase/tetratricopeptide (TPR) repeat protein
MAADPRRVKELFVALLDLPDAQARQAFLERECGDDAELRQRLEALLLAHENPASALERPMAAVEPPAIPPAEKSPAAPGLGETSFYHGPGEDVGSIIAGKYKLLEALGQGGMGDVFMAQQTVPVKRLVALKLIKLGMDSRQVLSRFETERQALALMDHPNIAKVLDAGATESGRPFFVMELVKGVPLTRFCDERQLSPRERLELFIPVCQAIQHAHQKGVIHRDIKPSNVLVALYDDRPVPKVIDFGVAKAAGSQLTDASLVTGFGAIVGTPEYMSPEQAQLNQLDIDTRSDVYALGVLLYELLTGTKPIDRKRLGQNALLEILRVIREEEPPRPSARLSTCEKLASIVATRRTEPAKLARLLRGELDWIVMKCLEKERSRRYETANALARDLERYLHDEMVEARPPSAGYRLRKVVRKHRTALAMAATVVLLLVAGVAVSTWQAVRATRAESETAQALHEAEESREEAVEQRRQADEQRKRAETQAASVAMDMDLKYCEDGEIALGLLRLAETLKSIPEHAKELRECAALNILAWGQEICPAIGPLTHDRYAVGEAILSPDGRTVLGFGNDGTPCLWDSLSGKQRRLLGQPVRAIQGRLGLLQFSEDGSTALTMHMQGFIEDGRYTGPGSIRLWDVATGQLRAALSEDLGYVSDPRLSQNGSLLVTNRGDAVFIWNAMTGQLLRKVACQGDKSPSIDVSPDGRWVLISQDGQFAVWSPESDQPLKRLPGDKAVFSPSGRSAASVSGDKVHWWDTQDWQLHRTINLSEGDGYRAKPSFVTDEVLEVRVLIGESPDLLVILRNMPEIIRGFDGDHALLTNPIEASRNRRVLALGGHVYDGLNGQCIPLPRGRRFHPVLSELAEDGRFTTFYALREEHELYSVPFHISYIVDLATDKKIDIGKVFDCGGRFLKDLEAWVVLGSGGICVVRKADASLAPELLQKWCQIITRGKLDEGDRFSKLDEAAWEKARLELTHLLDANPNAQSLRAAVSDALYWLRQEIKDRESSNPPISPLPLLDRLLAAEPTWPNYSHRAAAHAEQDHWDLAIQDDLEAARLAGERYWLGGASSDWQVGARSVQAPGHPQEQYERALRWVEARTRAGVYDLQISHALYVPSSNVIASLALFRLGRYAEALATLRKSDVRMLSQATGMLMSPWNLLTMMSYETSGNRQESPEITIRIFDFDPVDLLVRAMCHHRLGHPKEANARLNQARGILPKNTEAINADQRAFLREAESLIEGKPRP